MKLSCSSQRRSLCHSLCYFSLWFSSLSAISLLCSSSHSLLCFSSLFSSSLFLLCLPSLSLSVSGRRCLSLWFLVVVVSLLSLFLFLSLCSLLSVCLSEEHRRNPKKSPNSILKSGSGFFNFGSVFYNWAIYIS